MPWLTDGLRKSPGALRLAPNDARKDDLICIIFGCSVPLVLRRIPFPKQRTNPQPDASETRSIQQGANSLDASPPLVAPSPDDESEDAGELYTLVGECYVDHMMDGEAITYFKDENPVCQNFTLK